MSNVSIPSIAPWSAVTTSLTQIHAAMGQIEGEPVELCWDSNNLVLGAQVFLQPCNNITPTQVFNSLVQQDQGAVLSTVGDRTLCVELSDNGILSLQECRSGYAKQLLNLDQTGVSLKSDSNTCIAPKEGTYRQVVASSCETKSNITVVAVENTPRPMPSTYYTPLAFAGSNQCVDVKLETQLDQWNNTVSLGYAVPAACSGSPSQSWYWLWGQIRNVENGLCMEAQPTDTWNAPPVTYAKVLLNACQTSGPSQLWFKTNDNGIASAESFNCIHYTTANNTQAVLLGTDACTAADTLDGPRNFQGISEALSDSLGAPKCTTPRVRKDFRDLTNEEHQDFFKAFNHFHSIPSLMGRRNRYHDFVRIHAAGSSMFHGSAYFFPWHRYYIAILEHEMQAFLGNSSFAFPYWGWGADAATWNLRSTGILTPENFGTTAANKESNCVDDGFMNNTWVPTQGPCLVRYYNDTEEEGSVSMYSEAYMLATIATNPETNLPYTDYDSFRQVVEYGPHGSFHVAVGSGGQLSRIDTAVNDPIFWMHHNNMDRYWQYFQIANVNLTNKFDGLTNFPFNKWNNQVNVTQADLLANFNVPVALSMGVKSGSLCHDYQPYSKSIAAVSVMDSKSPLTRRSRSQRRSSEEGKTPADVIATLDSTVAGKLIQNDIAIKAAKADRSSVSPATVSNPSRKSVTPLPEDFLEQMAKMAKVDKNRVRKFEAAAQRFTDKLHAATDAKLKELFDKEYNNASFDQIAVATKIVIAEQAAKRA
ncbi:hypothetical protein HDU97_008417 [Phlyctochytrium planicorne]|nr:hypothetical protein HDU97_008417 [Phlyctochytrium planicorne]